MAETRAPASASIDEWNEMCSGTVLWYWFVFRRLVLQDKFPTFVRKLLVTETLTTHEPVGRKQEVNK